MPERNLVFGLRLRADDGPRFAGAMRVAEGQVKGVSGAIERSGRESRQAARAVKIYGAQGQVVATVSRRQASAVDAAARSTDRAGRAAAKAERRTRGLASGFLAAHGRAIAYGIGLGGGLVLPLQRLGRAALETAEANRELDNRLRLVTESEVELAAVRSELLGVSIRTRSDLDATAQIYSRIAMATADLGRDGRDTLRVVEILNKQVAIGGSSGMEASAGLIQFAQGLASGRLQGDELRSVMENLLGVQQGLVVGFRRLYEEGQIDFEVTRANIRDLAAEGKLGAGLLIDAILAAEQETEAAYADIEAGVRDSFRVLRLELRESFREGLAGASEMAAGVIQAINDRFAQGRTIREQTVRLYELGEPLAARDLIGVTGQEMRRLAADLRRELDEVLAGTGVSADSIVGRQLTDRLQQQLAVVEEELARDVEIDLSRVVAPRTQQAAEAELAAQREAAAREWTQLQEDALAPGERALAQLRERIALVDLYRDQISALDAANLEAFAFEAARQPLGELVPTPDLPDPEPLDRVTEAVDRQTDSVLDLNQAWADFEIPEAPPPAWAAAAGAMADSLGVAGVALRNITGALGQFAGATGKAFRLHQAAALATAVVSTAEGISRVIAQYATQPVLRHALTASIAVAGAAQIAAIRAQQPPRAFALGGVIDRRAEFEYGGGRRGLAGEAGPEAILPLRRGPGGRLGVEASGGSRSIRIVIGDVVVQAPAGTDDPGEFGRAAARGLLHEVRPLVREILVDEQRPGGALNRTDRIS